MAQVDYYKFFKKFPRFIDIDDTDAVKLALLKETKRMKGKLLPVTHNNVLSVSELRESGLKDYFDVKYKGKVILRFLASDENNVKVARPWTYFPPNDDKMYLSKEEITNIKRTILIDDMLKNKKNK